MDRWDELAGCKIEQDVAREVVGPEAGSQLKILFEDVA